MRVRVSLRQQLLTLRCFMHHCRHGDGDPEMASGWSAGQRGSGVYIRGSRGLELNQFEFPRTYLSTNDEHPLESQTSTNSLRRSPESAPQDGAPRHLGNPHHVTMDNS